MPQKNNKVAVVTGASRGIGYETALTLAHQGYHVVAIARTIGGLEDLDDAIQKIGGSATLVPVDVSDVKALQALGPNLATRFGHVDVVVAAAGYLSKLTSIAQGAMEHWTRALAINTTANLTLLQTLHPLLKQAQSPVAVFLTCDEKHIGRAYWGYYSASKAAMQALVHSYAEENPDIKAVTFAPQPTLTRLRDEAFPGDKQGQTAAETARDVMAFIAAQ